MRALPETTRSFAVLVVEDGRARISRFHLDVCGETLWEVGPEGLAQRLESVRPSLIAVMGERGKRGRWRRNCADAGWRSPSSW